VGSRVISQGPKSPFWDETVILLIETAGCMTPPREEKKRKEEKRRERKRKEEKRRKKEIMWVARWCSGPDSKNWGLLFGHISEETDMLRYI
jgi:hypothetical protein